MAFKIVESSPSTKDVLLTGRQEILVDSENDLATIPEDAPAPAAEAAQTSSSALTSAISFFIVLFSFRAFFEARLIITNHRSKLNS